MQHPAVLEAAVIGVVDSQGLTRSKAYVVLKPGSLAGAEIDGALKAFVVLKSPQDASEELAEALKAHVRERLAQFKYPRWVEFVAELPKTATGKIQRFKLRG